MPNNSEQVRAFVDRIESGLAVIVLGDGSGVQFDLPLHYLPAGTDAGDHLIISFRLDPEGRAAALQNISELKQRLTEDNDFQQTEFKL